MNSKNSSLAARKIVIVGGVAGGMSAAARARRISEDSEIIVIERNGYVSYANCGLPYLLGGEIESQEKLIVVTPDALQNKLNLDIRVNSEVIGIDVQAKFVSVRKTTTDEVYQESFDDLILSAGASPIRPNVPGIDLPGLFPLRSIEDVEEIQNWLDTQNSKKAVIAGGGFIGLEMAEQLVRRGLEVTLIDGKDQVLAPIDPEMAELVQNELRKQGVTIILGKTIQGFCKPTASVSTESYVPKSCFVLAGDAKPIAADLVILGLGVKPEVKLARDAGLTIGERGGIRVNDYLQTSTPHVWAVGDAIEVRHPISKTWTLISLGGPANRQGRIAADNIFGERRTYNGTLGTAVLRVFDLTIACVGLNETQLQATKIAYETVSIHPSQHASYYPGAERLDLKILFHKVTGELLGAQAVGKNGVDKRIDVIATAMKAKMNVQDLGELELAYAPPYGSAKDPVNLAGMAGKNVLEGLVEQLQWYQIETLNKENICFLDVRTNVEHKKGHISDTLHIPLPELRARLSEIPKEKVIVTYCQSGQRSYMAYRLLKQKGFQVKSLAGGYLTWSSMQSSDKTEDANQYARSK